MPFFPRLWLAIVTFFRIVFDGAFAQTLALPAPAKPVPEKPAAEKRDESALRLLALLQHEARFVDFCEEDLAAFPDAQIGAAARAVHAGCRKALRESFAPKAIRAEPEGAQVEVPAGFDPVEIRLTGNLTGNPPFRGALRHHGWRATRLALPSATGDADVLAPAEVELA